MANSASGETVAERIVRVLETFDTDRTVQTAAEIGRRARLPSTTAYRMVAELVECGLLEKDEDQRLMLGMRLWELALRGSRALRLRQTALPYMERVQSRIGEHTQLAVVEHDETLFIERLSHPRAGANITRIAGRLPLHASSSGLVLLAFSPAELRERVLRRPLRPVSRDTVTDPKRLAAILADIRRDGVVVAPGSVAPVSTGVAVPVREGHGPVVAALSVVLPRDAPTRPAIEELRAAAAGVSAALSARGTRGADGT